MRKKIMLLAGATGVVALSIAGATTASAHVTIRPDENTSGSYAKVTVRVPNESDEAATTELRLEFPKNTFGSVRVKPHPSWTAKVITEELDEPVEVGSVTLDQVVTAVTWTADGDGIGADEFDEFAISLGPLPEAGDYFFPAHQTYSDGEVVSWDMPPADEEPEHPAPVLTVGEGDDTTHHASDSSAESNDHADEDAVASDSDSSDGLARGIAVGGLVVGAAGVGVGTRALRRSRA